jgi:hypothetical protein
LAGLGEVLLDASLVVGLGGAGDLVAEGSVRIADVPPQPVAFECASGCAPAGAGARVGGRATEFGDRPTRRCRAVPDDRPLGSLMELGPQLGELVLGCLDLVPVGEPSHLAVEFGRPCDGSLLPGALLAQPFAFLPAPEATEASWQFLRGT